MGANTSIEWCQHTWNPWVGCTKVSDGCRNCYAETLMDKRYHKTKWGPKGLRVVKADAGWREPLKWNRAAEAAGRRDRVFCASLADVFEGPETMPADHETRLGVERARTRLFSLIQRTPNLDWLLLTKRPENIGPCIGGVCRGPDLSDEDADAVGLMLQRWMSGEPPANVWLGTSVENQAAADARIPHLLRCPAAVRFLSMEPLLGAVDLSAFQPFEPTCYCQDRRDGCKPRLSIGCPESAIDWVIVGTESLGKRAGRFADGYDAAARSILNQCADAGVPAFHKQTPINGRVSGDPAEWPAGLRVREFPKSTERLGG